jgi:hypothetical protein
VPGEAAVEIENPQISVAEFFFQSLGTRIDDWQAIADVLRRIPVTPERPSATAGVECAAPCQDLLDGQVRPARVPEAG